ncbi:uncharacterized protein ACN2A1_004147 [Glossina fuscipes fuscipes]
MSNGERYMKRSDLASALRCDLHINDILVFGNDSIISTYDKISPDDIQSVLADLTITVYIEESGFSSNISNFSLLGYQINYGHPLEEREKAIASLVWPERNDKCWDSTASRALAILQANL